MPKIVSDLGERLYARFFTYEGQENVPREWNVSIFSKIKFHEVKLDICGDFEFYFVCVMHQKLISMFQI